MKPIYSCTCIAAAFLLNTLCTQALAESESKAAVLILMPERVDVEWFWYHYGVCLLYTSPSPRD